MSVNEGGPEVIGAPTNYEDVMRDQAHPGLHLNKASEANIAHRTLLLAYTHIKAFEQRHAARGLP